MMDASTQPAKRVTDQNVLRGLTCPVESMQFTFLESGHPEKTIANVDFIGIIPHVSLITSLPQRMGRVISLGVGQPVSVKLCTGRYIQGFSSQVICSCKFPRPYAHIEYPIHVKTMLLRQAERVKFKLLALLKKGDREPLPVLIVELSGSGVAFMSDFDLGSVGEEISLSFTLDLAFNSYPVTVSGVIRQVRVVRSRKMYRYGVELNHLTEEQKLAIQACIYENL